MSAQDSVPTRDALLHQIRRANRCAWPWLVCQLVVIAILIPSIDWHEVAESPLFSTVAAAVIIGPYLMGVLRQVFLKKKEIGDLQEQTRFGEYDKHRLRTLMDDTLQRLGLPADGPPVYITADKSLNAGAVRLGLGGFFKSLNGVYLNRQLLHRLTPAEVQDVIGHELGHYYRHYLVTDRFEGVTLLLGGLLGVFLAQTVGLSNIIGMFVLCVSGAFFWQMSNALHGRNAEAIEYLCDDFGAQVHGVGVTINSLLKTGVDEELQVAIQQQALLSRHDKNLDARSVIEAIEAAIPYGHTSREMLEHAVEQSLKRRAQQEREVSLKGFLKYAWSDGDESEIEEHAQKLKRLQNLPRLNWEALIDNPRQTELSDRQIERLVELMESHPDVALFRLPESVGETDGVHPPIRSRILYLWKNRDAIEAARRDIWQHGAR